MIYFAPTYEIEPVSASNTIVHRRHRSYILNVQKHVERRAVKRSNLVRDPQLLRRPSNNNFRLQTRQALEIIRKLSVDYVNFIKECWIHASVCLQIFPLDEQFLNSDSSNLYLARSLFSSA